MAVRKVSKEKEVRMATVRGARHETGSRILSERDISRPDLEIELNNQMASDFVKIEDHKKQIDAIQIALGARMRRSFIAGAIFGTLILVAIIMAGVGLQKVEICRYKTAYNAREIEALEDDLGQYIKSDDLQNKLDALERKLTTNIEGRVSRQNFMSEFYKQVDPTKLKDKLPSDCISACNHNH